MTFLLFTIFVGSVITKLPKRVFMVLSFGGCTLSLFLLGPSSLLHIPNTLPFLLAGQALLGGSLGFVYIPILPEIIDSLYAANNLKEGEDDRIDSVIADKAAGLYGSFYSIGMILSPIMGSLIYEHYKE